MFLKIRYNSYLCLHPLAAHISSHVLGSSNDANVSNKPDLCPVANARLRYPLVMTWETFSVNFARFSSSEAIVVQNISVIEFNGTIVLVIDSLMNKFKSKTLKSLVLLNRCTSFEVKLFLLKCYCQRMYAFCIFVTKIHLLSSYN